MFGKNARRGAVENPALFPILTAFVVLGICLFAFFTENMGSGFVFGLFLMAMASALTRLETKSYPPASGMIFIWLLILATVTAMYHDSRIRESRQQSKNEMTTFAEEKAPVLHDSLKKTQQIQSEVLEKKQKLKQVLISLNRSADQDEDVKRYDSLLSDLEVTEKKLKVNLEDAFIAYKKYEISSDPAYERELSRLSSSSQLAAEEIQNKYKGLREKMSASMR